MVVFTMLDLCNEKEAYQSPLPPIGFIRADHPVPVSMAFTVHQAKQNSSTMRHTIYEEAQKVCLNTHKDSQQSYDWLALFVSPLIQAFATLMLGVGEMEGEHRRQV